MTSWTMNYYYFLTNHSSFTPIVLLPSVVGLGIKTFWSFPISHKIQFDLLTALTLNNSVISHSMECCSCIISAIFFCCFFLFVLVLKFGYACSCMLYFWYNSRDDYRHDLYIWNTNWQNNLILVVWNFILFLLCGLKKIKPVWFGVFSSATTILW